MRYNEVYAGLRAVQRIGDIGGTLHAAGHFSIIENVVAAENVRLSRLDLSGSERRNGVY